MSELYPVVLRRQRAIIKGSCTRIRTYVDNVESVTPSVTAQLEERRARLESYWAEYNAVQSQLEIIDENEGSDRVGFEEAFFNLSARIREIVNPTRVATRNAVTASPSTSNASGNPETVTHVRLPKLSLPTFSGKYDEWFPFHDAFSSIIHSNASLNNVQKLQYLRASLTDEASDIVSALEISDLNYDVAWTMLKKRYDNKRIVVHAHVKAIMELPSMNRENACELRQIADGAAKHIHALHALKRPTAHWDDLLVYILSSKLDTLTVRQWQTSLIGSEIPNFKQLVEFINHRCQVLEATGKSGIVSAKSVGASVRTNGKRQSACVATVRFKCSYCNGEHSVYHCKEFLALSIPRRIAEIRKRKICHNCLRSTEHVANKCVSGNCRLCRAKHNTLLHATPVVEPSDPGKGPSEDPTATMSPAALVTHVSRPLDGGYAMLSTAVAHVLDGNGLQRPCRILLDCGSQANFVSKKFLSILGLKPRSLNISISGINGAISSSTQIVKLTMQSRLNAYSFEVECIVADQVTDKLPSFSLRRRDFEFPHNMQLADPRFYESADVDALIGADLFWDLICVGQIRASHTHPTLQKTRLGWILAGRSGAAASAQRIQAFHSTITNAQLHEQIKRFCQQEDIAGKSVNHSIEEAYCEKHFLDNVSQMPSGKYIVKLPVKDEVIVKLGSSRDTALKRLQALERRFRWEPALKAQYEQFMDEYEALGHMRMMSEESEKEPVSCDLPHHCVLKTSERGVKLRVVFDASCDTSTGVSLNDALRVGPVIQQDLMSILMRFRFFLYVIAADVIKMYRQILVDPSQTPLQRILWRRAADDIIKTCELLTVTYGTASASYLAIKCLDHLADQHKASYPVGSRHIKRGFYVDDMLSGADTIDDARQVRDEVIQVLRLGTFELSKWASNCPKLLEGISDQNHNLVRISDDAHSRVLGMQWDHSKDTFQVSHDAQENHGVVSKRTILSGVARLFDPLGLLGPVIVTAKLILQELWQLGIDWDESVPQSIHTRWSKLEWQLPALKQLEIPRCVKFTVDPRSLQIHGFCDASQRAYGACIYIRTKIDTNEYRVELLCSRSRVAPIKAISLPRLELSAALLLARLLEKVQASMDVSGMETFLWTDSTIVLSWIVSPSRRWEVFVANRTGEIQRLTRPEDWRHVASSDNPADVLSRGLYPHELGDSSLWWHGPTYLQLHEDRWPASNGRRSEGDLPEKLETSTAGIITSYPVIQELFKKNSDLTKICRIIAYCLRCRKSHRPTTPTGFISHSEMSYATGVMSRAVQKSAFPEEYGALSRGGSIKPSSKILSLSPFMDENGLMRVGGRLQNSNLQFDVCHPILLPREHDLTKRIIYQEHVRGLHAGTQATMAAVRQRFWPLSLRSTTRKIIKNCVTCFRAKPSQSEALMGSLPAGRVTVSRPFSHCGVDYAGPITIKEGKRRNARKHKAYIAIFVCFATKGVHIELISDLTSESFIGSLRRFISRRGKPSRIYSDNGTTFVGAYRQIKEFYDLLNSDQVQGEVRQFLREHETDWSFIPPNAPHFGGLWEAAVKSAKYHMARIIGRAHLSFEEMQTVLCEIEAILNSRPLTQLSADPNDFAYLSPGHFLIGTALNSFPCHDLCDVNENRLTRWQVVQQIGQHFWRKWSSEYLHSLQERTKWKSNKGPQLRPGQLVLIKQQDLAPLQWRLGRVQEIHSGSDGVTRTATVRTAKGLLTRPLSKLAILPTDSQVELG